MYNQRNNNTEMDNDGEGPIQRRFHRERNFYRKRIGGERQNQDLGEDEYHASNDEDAQRSNTSNDNNFHDNEHVNNYRGRGRRFWRDFRGDRGGRRFNHGRPPFFGNYRREISPYSNYSNYHRGFHSAPPMFYDRPFRGRRFRPGGNYGPRDDIVEQEGGNNFSMRGYHRGFHRGFYRGFYRGFPGGRGRRFRPNQREIHSAPNENIDNNQKENQNGESQLQQDQVPQGDHTETNENKQVRRSSKYRRRRRRANGEGSGTEQRNDGGATDDQQNNDQHKGSGGQRHPRSGRRRYRNTNASQSGGETEEQRPKTPKDDEAIVKAVVRSLVSKVVRRLTSKSRRRNRNNKKELVTHNDNQQNDNPGNTGVDEPRTENLPQRGGFRGRRFRRGYFVEQGYYGPYGIPHYYHRNFYDYGGRGYRGRGRGRGGRGRGGFYQRGGNKENQQPHNEQQINSEGEKTGESNGAGDVQDQQSKTTTTEQISQSIGAGDYGQQ